MIDTSCCLCGHVAYVHYIDREYPDDFCHSVNSGISCRCKHLNTKPTIADQKQEIINRLRRARIALNPSTYEGKQFDESELYDRLNDIVHMITVTLNELEYQKISANKKEGNEND